MQKLRFSVAFGVIGVSALVLATSLGACGGANVNINDLFDEAGTNAETGGSSGSSGSSGALEDGGVVDGEAPCLGSGCPTVCPAGKETSLSGKVYAPNGATPLYNVIVYAPKSALAPITHGPTCERCGSVSGDPIVSTITDAKGNFTLKNVPDGKDVRIVLQTGKWRREIKVPEIKPCEDNAISSSELTRLPRTQAEGDIPRIALTAGMCDQVGCMLPKIGIAASEFGVSTDGTAKSVHTFAGNSPGPSGATSATENLWNDATKLAAYDLVILSCECSENLTNKGGGPDGPPFALMTDYVKKGGRIFTTDFQYVWYRYSPDLGMQGAFNGRWNAPAGGPNLRIDTSFPRGAALAEWLEKSAGLASPGTTVTPSYTFGNLISNDTSKSRRWASDSTQVEPRVVSVNLPTGVAAGQHCGRALHVDAHVNSSDNVGTTFPSGCSNTMLEGDSLLAFMLFDLGSCIQDDAVAPAPPKAAK